MGRPCVHIAPSTLWARQEAQRLRCVAVVHRIRSAHDCRHRHHFFAVQRWVFHRGGIAERQAVLSRESRHQAKYRMLWVLGVVVVVVVRKGTLPIGGVFRELHSMEQYQHQASLSTERETRIQIQVNTVYPTLPTYLRKYVDVPSFGLGPGTVVSRRTTNAQIRVLRFK